MGLAATSDMRDARAVRSVVIVAFPGVQALDVAGPAEVFAQAGGYHVRVAAPGREPLATGSGYAIVPELALAGVDLARLDTLLVAGGAGTRAAVADDGLVAWLAAAAPHARRVASVCTGAFLLARAGLLDGRRATTHSATNTDRPGTSPRPRREKRKVEGVNPSM